MSRCRKPRRPEYFPLMKYRARKRHQHAWVLYTVPNVRFDERLWATLPILDLSIFESLEACE